jgi:integrase
MKLHTLIQTICTNGERFPMLVDDSGVPNFWSTLFTSQQLRDQTQSSITSCLNNIEHLYKWEKINNRNITQDFENSLVPGSKFVESIKDHCGLRSEHIQKELLQKSFGKTISFNELKLARASALSQVSCDYQQRRMSDICAFLMFVGSTVLKKKPNSKVLINDLNIFKKTIQSHYPKSSFSRYNKQLPHAEKEIFEKFLEIFNPHSKLNPFKGYDLKLRNYLLVQLLYWTGARSGEILSMTLDDIDYDLDTPKVRVERRHDDIADSRKYQPVTKTKSREIIIPTWLRDELDYYINKIRCQYSASKNHPYIFVSHKGKTIGQPVTNSTFYNRVILPVKALDSHSFALVKRHGFRHLFNENLSDKIDSHNAKINQLIAEAEMKKSAQTVAELKKNLINEQQEIEIRMSLNGHSSKNSALPYVERHVKKKAQRIHKEMMRDMSEFISKVRGVE